MNFKHSAISWGSVIAGVVTTIAIGFLLMILGTSLGLSMLSPESNDIINAADTTVVIWSGMSIVVGLVCGGFVAGRLAGIYGGIHGFLVWSTSIIFSVILSVIVINSIVKTTANAVGGLASVAGNVSGEIGSVVGNIAEGSVNAGQNIFGSLNVDANGQPRNIESKVVDALKKSNIKELQPEYISQQLNLAGQDIASAAKEVAINPDNIDQIADGLKNKLKGRIDTIGNSIDSQAVENALVQNTSMTPDEAKKTVNNLLTARDKAVSEANNQLENLVTTIDESKEKYSEISKEFKQKTDEAAKVAAKTALSAFFALFIGLIVSAFAGLVGARSHRKLNRVE